MSAHILIPNHGSKFPAGFFFFGGGVGVEGRIHIPGPNSLKIWFSISQHLYSDVQQISPYHLPLMNVFLQPYSLWSLSIHSNKFSWSDQLNQDFSLPTHTQKFPSIGQIQISPDLLLSIYYITMTSPGPASTVSQWSSGNSSLCREHTKGDFQTKVRWCFREDFQSQAV